MKDLIKAANDNFGKGEWHGAVFFKHNPDGSVKSISPLFMMDMKISDPNCKPGEGIRELVKNLKQWAAAIDYMADDMVKKTLPNN